jgi:hypothetical protein
MIAPGHGKPFPIDRETARNFEKRAVQQDGYFRSLIADPDTDFGLDPSWIRIQPYQISAVAGREQRIQIHLRNYGRRPMQVEMELVLPPGWRSGPAPLHLNVAGNTEGHLEASFTIPSRWSAPTPRVAIALDVMANGKYLGQIAEAVVDVRNRFA